MKIPGAPSGPGTPEPEHSGVSGQRKSVEKIPVNPHAETTGQVRPDRKTTADAARTGEAAFFRRPAGGKTPPTGAGLTTGHAAGRAIPAQVTNAGTVRPNRTVPVQTAPEPAGADSKLRNLLSALKLPNDSLSQSLVSFSRFFFLPLENSSLGALRREVLVQKKREASALGAAAAASKGLVLESSALKAYADAIDPAEWQEPGQRESGQQPARQESETAQQEQQKPEQAACIRNGAGDGSANGKQAEEELKRQITAVLGKGPVPDFINRIPGKNGRRWIVVPFSYSGEGFDVRASFRILLPDPKGSDSGTGRFAADIAVFREQKLSRRWFLLLEGRSGGDFKAERAEFSVFPPLSDIKTLKRELAKLFALPDNKIALNKKGCFADSRNNLLLTVDEAV